MKSALVLQAPLTEDYKNLADRSRDIIYHFHVSSGKFLFFNKKGLEIYGFGTKKSVLLKIHPEDREMVRLASRRALVPGCVMGEVEYRICLPNNCVRWMHDRWTVMRDAEGAPLAIEGIIRDNTDKKRIESKLQERERELAAKAKNLYLSARCAAGGHRPPATRAEGPMAPRTPIALLRIAYAIRKTSDMCRTT